MPEYCGHDAALAPGARYLDSMTMTARLPVADRPYDRTADPARCWPREPLSAEAKGEAGGFVSAEESCWVRLGDRQSVWNDARTRLRDLVGVRLGLRTSSLPDARVDGALLRLLHGDAAAAPELALATLPALPFTDPAWQRVIGALVVGETNFFRQRSWFTQLEEHVLKPLVAAGKATRRLRVWSAGCASGEEPYSVAIALHRLIEDPGDWDIRIVGTDASLDLLAAAGRASYRAWSLRELDPDARNRFFTAAGEGRFALAPALRAMVSFAPFNLTDGAPVHAEVLRGGVDLVLCRNVLMYLTADEQPAVSRRLAGYVAPAGWLAVAPLEANTEWFHGLTPVNVPSAIFFRREGAP